MPDGFLYDCESSTVNLNSQLSLTKPERRAAPDFSDDDDDDDEYLMVPLAERLGLVTKCAKTTDSCCAKQQTKSDQTSKPNLTKSDQTSIPNLTKSDQTSKPNLTKPHVVEERLTKAKLKAKEKERSKALKEAGKTKQLTRCHEYCTTYLDEKILEVFNIKEELETIFREKGAPLILENDPPIEFGVAWKREAKDLVEEISQDNVSINVVPKQIEVDHILKILNFLDLISLAYNSIQQVLNPADDQRNAGVDECQSLFDFVTQLLDQYKKNMTLVLYGFEKYCTQQKNRQNQEYRAQLGLGKKSTQAKDCLPSVKKSDLELVLFDLQVKLSQSSYSSQRVHIVLVENGSELCSILWSHTRSVAVAHIKQAQRNEIGLDWYAQNDAHGCVDILTEADITSLWTKQLMTFSKMSMEMAKAISDLYPSPQALLAAYDACESDQDREELLTYIEVSRENQGKGKTVKKLGSLASRKIYSFLTTRDSCTILD